MANSLTDSHQSDAADNSSLWKKVKQLFNQYVGVLSGGLSGLGNATQMVISKYVTAYCGPAQISIGRDLAHIPINILIVKLRNESFRIAQGEVFYVFLKTVVDFLTCLFNYIAMMYISYLETIVVYYGTMIILSIIISRVCFSEKFTFISGTVVLLMFSGIILTCKPDILFDSTHFFDEYKLFIWGYFWAFLSSLAVTLDGYINKLLVKTPPLTSTLYAACGSLIMAMFSLLIPQLSKFEFRWLVCLVYLPLIGLFGICSRGFWAYGFQVGRMSDVLLASQVDIPAGVIIQLIILGIMPTINELIGSVCITLGFCLLVIQDDLYNLLLRIFDMCKKNKSKEIQNAASVEKTNLIE